MPLLSYIPNEVILPRQKLAGQSATYVRPYHAVPLAAVDSPANVIAITELRDDIVDTSAAHRPLNAFIPFEPYKSLTPIVRATVANVLSGGVNGNPGPNTRLQYAALKRHSGGANYTFGDGHAKWHRFEQTMDANNWLWGERFYSAE